MYFNTYLSKEKGSISMEVGVFLNLYWWVRDQPDLSKDKVHHAEIYSKSQWVICQTDPVVTLVKPLTVAETERVGDGRIEGGRKREHTTQVIWL